MRSVIHAPRDLRVRTRTRGCQGWSEFTFELINVGIVKTTFEVTPIRNTATRYRETITRKS